MERHLQYNEAFLEIYGNAASVLALLPETTQRKAVAPETVAACRPAVISPGGSKFQSTRPRGARRPPTAS